jgi:hypothetical protein
MVYGVVVRFPVKRQEVGHLPSLPKMCSVQTVRGLAQHVGKKIKIIPGTILQGVQR